MNVDNGPLKSGYIFIHAAYAGPAYQVSRLGGLGYFAKLDPNEPNGYIPVKLEEYEAVG